MLFVWLVVGTAKAAPMPVADVPEPLKTWVPWVLHGMTELNCPYVQTDTQQRRCAWPSRLELTLGDQRGEFVQEWLVYEAAWVPLPGDDQRWPQEVRLTAKSPPEPVTPAGAKPGGTTPPPTTDSQAVVQVRDGQPGIELTPGAYRVSGAFLWDSLPEKLQVPAETGLLALKVRGEVVAFPQRDNTGVLWLQKRAPEGSEENLLDVVVHRRISDTIPLVVTTQVEIHASGKNREVLLGKALLADFVAMEVRSDLPARLEADGRLRVQIRPGRWTVTIEARHPGPVQQLALATSDDKWAEEEIWAFAAEPTLRRVEVDGVTAVDPQQTLLPGEWKKLPAYRVRPGEAMLLTETHRGEVDRGPDQLTLSRQWWLDFDGRGFSIRDELRGEIHDTRRLEVRPPAQLGYAESQGAPQFITSLTASDHPGVELRSTNLDLRADMRVPGGGLEMRLSAVDWDQDFASLSGQLHLPPGWRLLHVIGVDEVDDTWLQRWTLLDLFLVLVISIAIARLYGWPWGTLALFTLVLCFPEWMAPRTVWVFVLVAEAVHRALPAGRMQEVVRVVRFGVLLLLTSFVLVFTIQQIRGGLYPALGVRSDRDDFGVLGARGPVGFASDEQVATVERADYAPQRSKSGEGEMGGNVDYDGQVDQLAQEVPAADDTPTGGVKKEPESPMQRQQGERRTGSLGASSMYRKQQKLREYDANTVVQTGSGLPSWSWRSVRLGWNGPVTRDQQVRLFLVPPHLNLALAFIRVLFLVTLLLAVFGRLGRRRGALGASGALAAALAFGAGVLAPGTAAAQVPDEQVLSELRARLIETPTCLPSCATSPRMRLEATAGGLRLVQEVHVSAAVAVPLPGNGEQWLPTSVLVDGSPTSGGIVRTPAGTLAVELRPGRHELVIEGPLPARETVQIGLPLKPHRVEARAVGWTVDGLHEDGLADDNLQLTRVSPQDGKDKPAELEVGTLPAFVRLERSLQLGLNWEITTRVVRLTPRGSAVVLGVPLLPGESVTTADLRVEGGEVLVNMPPDISALEWTSSLQISPTITLAAAVGEPWTEVWQVEVGPVWHVEHESLPTVRQGEGGLREWRPWPGEQVTLTITRPEGVPGQTLTIDRASLTLEPGLRAVDARLSLDLRSSRGGHHVLEIPEGALLQGVTIRGARQTIGQEGRSVRVPVEPGAQTIELSWRETHDLRQRYVGPEVDLGAPAVNVDVVVQFPASRWILLVGGPRLGPAVLFWSFVIMLLLAAAVLSRLRWSPLRGHQWFLLGLGLSPLDAPLAMLVVGWFLALAWRRERTDVAGWWFDLRQLILIGWTLVACVCLAEAIRMGLLGQPDMQIEGNASYGGTLRWFQDRVDGGVPQPWVLSVSIWWYRGLMLAWALWLAWSLIRWLPWAWHSFGSGGLWRSGGGAPRLPDDPGPGGRAKHKWAMQGTATQMGDTPPADGASPSRGTMQGTSTVRVKDGGGPRVRESSAPRPGPTMLGAATVERPAMPRETLPRELAAPVPARPPAASQPPASSRPSASTSGPQPHMSSASEAIFAGRNDPLLATQSQPPVTSVVPAKVLPSDTVLAAVKVPDAEPETQVTIGTARVVRPQAGGSLPLPDSIMLSKPKPIPPPPPGGPGPRSGQTNRAGGGEPEEVLPDDDETL